MMIVMIDVNIFVRYGAPDWGGPKDLRVQGDSQQVCKITYVHKTL